MTVTYNTDRFLLKKNRPNALLQFLGKALMLATEIETSIGYEGIDSSIKNAMVNIINSPDTIPIITSSVDNTPPHILTFSNDNYSVYMLYTKENFNKLIDFYELKEKGEVK